MPPPLLNFHSHWLLSCLGCPTPGRLVPHLRLKPLSFSYTTITGTCTSSSQAPRVPPRLH
uniref:Uncharacterized protein n=1 Tax=Oryza brachyantha TaxID=4533 RepID=J3N7G4_ORYBR